MSTTILTDISRNIASQQATVHASGVTATLHTLQGGRRGGVQLVELANQRMSVSIVPTRGMGLWRAHVDGQKIGWDSPVRDGPVHPSFVNQAALGGLGWLDGFDEMMVRCGLTQNGPPSPVTEPFAIGLHGLIANRPAHYLAVHEGPDRLTVEGHVDEACLFGYNLRLVSKITLMKDSSAIEVADEVINLGDGVADLELLYHWNFGSPWLEGGGQLVAAAEEVVPRDATAQRGIDSWDVYDEPMVGYAEQAFFFRMKGDAATGQTSVMLKNAAGDKGLALHYDVRQMPCFTLWKNTAGQKSGYVTGLEPATNYPNPKKFEKEQGRVIGLMPGASHQCVTTLEALVEKADVARVEAGIERLRASAQPVVHRQPVRPMATGG
ncbi:MAG: aldose 1-epimerase family protein [bacterium]